MVFGHPGVFGKDPEELVISNFSKVIHGTKFFFFRFLKYSTECVRAMFEVEGEKQIFLPCKTLII